jgi:general transcription factor 3C polypeptide 3 (transcription factor C subunit 4)
MVNLSLGLAYVHYGLKRQSTNRQYLLLQGQSFLSQYADFSRQQGQSCPMAEAEAYYNLGRLFQLLGINSIALEYYAKARKVEEDIGGTRELNLTGSYNEVVLLLYNRNNVGALQRLKQAMQL